MKGLLFIALDVFSICHRLHVFGCQDSRKCIVANHAQTSQHYGKVNRVVERDSHL